MFISRHGGLPLLKTDCHRLFLFHYKLLSFPVDGRLFLHCLDTSSPILSSVNFVQGDLTRQHSFQWNQIHLFSTLWFPPSTRLFHTPATSVPLQLSCPGKQSFPRGFSPPPGQGRNQSTSLWCTRPFLYNLIPTLLPLFRYVSPHVHPQVCLAYIVHTLKIPSSSFLRGKCEDSFNYAFCL